MVGNEVNFGWCVDRGSGTGVEQVECWEMEGSLKGSFFMFFNKVLILCWGVLEHARETHHFSHNLHYYNTSLPA